MSELHDLRLAVLGLGHVGLPTALGLAELGWDVVGTDDDLEKAQAIAGGRVPFYEPGVEELLKRHLDSGRFVVEPDVPAAMREATVLFVCVGTPEVQGGAPDLSQLERVARSLASNLNGYKLIVEKSTTPVQTSRQIEESILRYSRLRGRRRCTGLRRCRKPGVPEGGHGGPRLFQSRSDRPGSRIRAG